MPGPSGAEPRYGLPYPILSDTPDAEKDMKALSEAIAAIDMGRSHLLQPGILTGSSDYNFTTTLTTATGELSPNPSTTAGQIWLPDPIVGDDLMLHWGTNQTFKIKPPSLPANGKYMCVLICVGPSKWLGNPVFSLVSGTEAATVAAAEAARPSPGFGKVALREVVLKNNAGVYALELDRDRRPWAKGAYYSAVAVEGANIVSTAAATIPFTQVRLECSGNPIKTDFIGRIVPTSAWQVWLQMDGTPGVAETGTWVGPSSFYGNTASEGFVFDLTFTPPAGSHLFVMCMRPVTAGKTMELLMKATQQVLPSFAIQEVLKSVQNNGTV